jgi:hypothetical protein
MKKLHGSLMIAVILTLVSCNPKIATTLSKSYPPLDYREEVEVIGPDGMEPDFCEFLGEVKVGDSGFTVNCSFETVLEEAKLAARKAGGNVIRITEHKLPSPLISSCHRITARILRVENEISGNKDEEEFIPDIDYAVLNVYRYSGPGAAIGYDLHLGDTVLCRVINNFKTTLRITKDGMNTLWARTESKAEIPVDFEFGRVYYLRCSIAIGVLLGRPKLELVDARTGRIQFESFNARNQ